ncbi:flavin-binding monooxygenase-like protein [Aspergillus puulaauensis]|uniref:FAD/NAD(P)-binding domain-containing protein n=1 Tax=Aspergillus puulaauensis TaxID=1220207 RepID=A0A7R7XBB2_9EURO|nr:uncharacterized protein APUU_10392S [Aspergillus puulaauensis]BCS17564.1 hypothetical protein APUU_10392S [Aspergillus puulaauensis]
MESLDLLVIGAGWSGLAALKTYREVHPSASVCLLEGASSVGGVWATHRLWDGLKSNNMRGTYEYSDFPMDDSYGVKHGEHIPGHVVQRYLERYAQHFGIVENIRLQCRVSVVEHHDDTTWTVTYVDSTADGDVEVQVHARKLILATGITSQPYLAHIPGQETFDRPLFHTVDMPIHHKSTVQQAQNRIAVLGATKSAWDAVYTAASAGAQVDWIIRDNGHGPCWMAPPYVTPLHRWLEKLVTTRLLTWFSPCIWSDPIAEQPGSRVRRFLHGTWLGRKITDTFWTILGNDVVSLNKFNSHPELAKLKPWISPFWVASGLSILNYPTNFFDLVTQGHVRIHVDHIDHLSQGTIHLSNTPDPLSNISALIVASGWEPTPSITFLPASLPSLLGFPNAPDPLPQPLISAADTEILRRFPRLAKRPTHASPSKYSPLAPDAQTETQSLHPYRLTRFMVPASPLAAERSVAFAGIAMTINTPLLAQTQALWIAAFFSDRLSLQGITTERCPVELARSYCREGGVKSSGKGVDVDVSEQGTNTDADILYETALHTQFGVHRYPGGLGRRNPDFVFDAIPYVDVLLKDLGIEGARKSDRGWKRCVEPYGVEDYVGLVGEWRGRDEKIVA